MLSVLHSNYSSSIFSYWTDFIQIIVITYLITMVVRSEKELKITLIAMSLSLGLEGAKQGWVHIILHPGSINNNGHAVFGENNGVAIGMLMIVPLLFALYQATERKLIKYGFLFLAIGVAYRALSTYSRGGFLSFIAMCLVYGLRSKYKIRSVVMIVLIVALLLPMLPQAFWDRMDTITVSEGETRERSSASRLHFWQVAWEMAKENPIFGVGHLAYANAYDYYDFSRGLYGSSRPVHSSWFGVLADWGFPGLILFLSIYFYSIYSCAHVQNRCKNNPELKSLGIYSSGIEASLITCSVGISFLTLQYLEMLWHLFALAVVCNQILHTHYATENGELKSAAVNTDLLERNDIISIDTAN